jgi:hypothetical protein
MYFSERIENFCMSVMLVSATVVLVVLAVFVVTGLYFFAGNNF